MSKVANPIRKLNFSLSADAAESSYYIFMPPYSHKTPPEKVEKTNMVDTDDGPIFIDWSDGKVCGIQFPKETLSLNLI